MRKPTIWVPTRSDTNRAVQSQMIAKSLKFLMNEEEGLYYSCSENKGTDQLRDYRKADLRLWFCICRLLVFSSTGADDSLIPVRLYIPVNIFFSPIKCG